MERINQTTKDTAKYILFLYLAAFKFEEIQIDIMAFADILRLLCKRDSQILKWSYRVAKAKLIY